MKSNTFGNLLFFVKRIAGSASSKPLFPVIGFLQECIDDQFRKGEWDMKYEIKTEKLNDAFDMTKLYWEYDEADVTTEQLDWHFSNLEKVYHLWHPNCHIDFKWLIPQDKTPIGAVHWASEYYGPDPDHMMFTCIGIRQLPLEEVPPFILDQIEYDHVLVFAALPAETPDQYPYEERNYPMYVVHSYTENGSSTKGMDGTFYIRETNFGAAWAPHGTVEAAGIEKFLPQLFELYKLVDNRQVNRQYDFRVEGSGVQMHYINL